jgi:hypothetical protein
MRRSIWLLGAVLSVLFVGCGPPDSEELSQQDQSLKATPILFGASCPAANTCGPDYGRCTEWSEPSSCGDPSSGIAVQFQMCFDAQGNGCLQSSLSPAIAR